MRKDLLQKRSMMALVLFIFVSLAWTGCSTTAKGRQGEESTRERYGVGRYYHFDDIRVPKELNYNQKKSFVYETPKFKTGILVLSKWRLDVESLIDFFIYHMEKDNWKLVNIFKGKESILNFSKPEKTCAIKITENWYGSTEVEIRVGPLGEKKM